jgi:FtsP/CotA-like multicopper oxidase with cupredoxin domain
MRLSPMRRFTAAPSGTLRLPLDRRGFISRMIGALAMIILPSATPRDATAASEGWTVLRVREGDISVNGKTGRVYSIQQADGASGYVGTKGQRLRIVLQNHTSEPIAIHWHGIILPNGQDGVPYVTQPPIKPGAERRYDFPIVQAGTYWMHSHFGLQEQGMMTAPLILKDPEDAHRQEQDVVIMLNDFTVRSAADILAELQGGTKPEPGGTMSMPGGMTQPMPGMGMGAMPPGKGKMDVVDVKYDALLANRRTLSDPEVVRVQPGQTVRLRLIAASSGTNFFINTGTIDAQAIAVDGEDIVPWAGRRFELAVAQRLDLRLQIPSGGGAFPILAQGEGTRLRAGLILATPNAPIPILSQEADTVAGALTNAQELQLRATRPLPAKPVDRRLEAALSGDMAKYVWTINGEIWPKITPLEVKKGERVEIVFTNHTGMAHPMHLHGHVFQVTEIGGTTIAGATRDTVLVPPSQTVKVQFDAAYPGYWMMHCHLLYHQAGGMMTVVKYQGFEDASYNPLASKAEFHR